MQNVKSRRMKRPSYEYPHITATIPPQVATRLVELNTAAETLGKVPIGRSFIVRFAIEELLKRPDLKEAIVERKIDNLRGKVFA